MLSQSWCTITCTPSLSRSLSRASIKGSWDTIVASQSIAIAENLLRLQIARYKPCPSFPCFLDTGKETIKKTRMFCQYRACNIPRKERENQEPRKGGFSKGSFCRAQRHGQGSKNIQGYWPQQYIWHSESHSQERRTFCKNPLLKTPFSWFLRKRTKKNREFLSRGKRNSIRSRKGRTRNRKFCCRFSRRIARQMQKKTERKKGGRGSNNRSVSAIFSEQP